MGTKEEFLEGLIGMVDDQKARDMRPAVIVETFHLDGSDEDAARALGLYADTHRIAHAMLPEPGYGGRARVVWERRS